jgi:aldose 1-epimerase
MFTVTFIKKNGFDIVALNDTLNQTTAEIIPGCGAMLHAFSGTTADGSVNVIDHYNNYADYKNNLEAQGFKSCKLSPFVCRLAQASYSFAQKKYTVQKFLLQSSAIHGLIYDAPFQLTHHWSNTNEAGAIMQYQYNSTDAGYPFVYTCTVTYILKNGNALTITTIIKNNDKGLLPVQDGWHPYFSFGRSINDLQMEFQSKEMVEFDSGLVPTGKLIPYEEFGSLKKIGTTQLDNCFTLNFAECQPMCVLRDVTKKIQVEIHPDISYPYLQIYTPPHRNSIAIENLSGAPDAFNNGMGVKILTPGESASFTTVYKITSLS